MSFKEGFTFTLETDRGGDSHSDIATLLENAAKQLRDHREHGFVCISENPYIDAYWEIEREEEYTEEMESAC